MFKKLFVAFFLTVLIVSPTSAQQWFAEEGQGVRSAGIEYGSTTLSVTCVQTAANQTNSLFVSFYRVGPEGVVNFDFGAGVVVPVPFQDGSLRANSPTTKQIFSKVVGLMKSNSTVTISDPSVGAKHTFSLQGSTDAIGPCLIQGETNAHSGPEAGVLNPKLTWTLFKESCAHVFSDPDGYLAALDRPGAMGERVISVSPDQKVVSVYHRQSNAYEEMELHIVGDRQIFDCTVIGEFHDVETTVLATRLVDLVSLENGTVISGGHAPQDYLEAGSIHTENDIYLFGISGVWPENDLLVTAKVIAGELQFNVQQAR